MRHIFACQNIVQRWCMYLTDSRSSKDWLKNLVYRMARYDDSTTRFLEKSQLCLKGIPHRCNQNLPLVNSYLREGHKNTYLSTCFPRRQQENEISQVIRPKVCKGAFLFFRIRDRFFEPPASTIHSICQLDVADCSKSCSDIRRSREHGHWSVISRPGTFIDDVGKWSFAIFFTLN